MKAWYELIDFKSRRDEGSLRDEQEVEEREIERAILNAHFINCKRDGFCQTCQSL